MIAGSRPVAVTWVVPNFLNFPEVPSNFVIICLDLPDLSQCLNDIKQVKYNSTLTVKCYAPGNPDPIVKCELWDENNVVLHSEGKYFYWVQVM